MYWVPREVWSQSPYRCSARGPSQRCRHPHRRSNCCRRTRSPSRRRPPTRTEKLGEKHVRDRSPCPGSLLWAASNVAQDDPRPVGQISSLRYESATLTAPILRIWPIDVRNVGPYLQDRRGNALSQTALGPDSE